MTPLAHARVLATLMAGLERGPATVVAPDVGVPAALALAQDHPHLVSGLVVFDGPAHYPPDMSWEVALLGRSRIARRLMRYSGLTFAAIAFQRGYRVARPDKSALREYLRLSASPRRFGLTLDYQASYRHDLPKIAARLPEIDAPVMVCWGLEDPFVLPAEGQRIAASIRNARWEPLAGCGHFAHEDAGERFLDLLVDWHTETVVDLDQGRRPSPAATPSHLTDH